MQAYRVDFVLFPCAELTHHFSRHLQVLVHVLLLLTVSLGVGNLTSGLTVVQFLPLNQLLEVKAVPLSVSNIFGELGALITFTLKHAPFSLHKQESFFCQFSVVVDALLKLDYSLSLLHVDRFQFINFSGCALQVGIQIRQVLS